jgi:hypothetical protein
MDKRSSVKPLWKLNYGWQPGSMTIQKSKYWPKNSCACSKKPCEPVAPPKPSTAFYALTLIAVVNAPI